MTQKYTNKDFTLEQKGKVNITTGYVSNHANDQIHTTWKIEHDMCFTSELAGSFILGLEAANGKAPMDLQSQGDNEDHMKIKNLYWKAPDMFNGIKIFAGPKMDNNLGFKKTYRIC